MRTPPLCIRRLIAGTIVLVKWNFHRVKAFQSSTRLRELLLILIFDCPMLTSLFLQVNVPKTRRTYCKGKDCKKHTQHKVTQYKAGKVRGSVHVETNGTSNVNWSYPGIRSGSRETTL